MAAQLIQLNEDLQLLVACAEEPLAKESGWWVMRSFNRKTLQWKDYPLPGHGLTLWLSPDAVKRLGIGRGQGENAN